MSLRLPAVVVLAMAALLSASCARPSVSDVILAEVNGEPVTVGRLEESFTSSHQGHGVLLAGHGVVREFLDKVIDKRLLIQEGRRVGADEQPEIVKAREALRAKRAGEGYYVDQVTHKVWVAEGEVTAVHARLGERFNARHILVSTREEAERARQRVKVGEEFGDVARQVSKADTASRGGDLGVVQWGRLGPKMEDELWALQKGEMSKPFETEEGWNLLLVEERISAKPPTLEEARALIEANLSQRESKARSAALYRRLTKKGDVNIDEAPLFAALTAPDGKAPPPSTVVAEAGGEKVTLEKALKLVNAEAARKLPPDRMKTELRWVLEGEVYRILLDKEGLARGYGERPAVERELAKLTDDWVLEYLLGNVVLPKVEVEPADVEAYYRSHAKEFTEPEAIMLSAILVESEDDARDVMVSLAQGKDFGTLARTLSKDPTLVASRGQIAGWTTRGTLDPAVEEVAFSLKPGAVGTAKGGAGYFVVRVEERRPERLIPLDDVKEQARERALREKSRQEVKLWVDKLRAASTIEVDEQAIDLAIASFEETAREKAGKKMGHP